MVQAAQVCCGGVLQGSGRQRDGYLSVVVAYYCVGLPLGCVLGFHSMLGVRGMVLGLLCGKLCHCGAFAYLAMRTRWDEQVAHAAARVRGERTVKGSQPPPIAPMAAASEGERSAPEPEPESSAAAVAADDHAGTGTGTGTSTSPGGDGVPPLNQEAHIKAKGKAGGMRGVRRYAPLA